LRRDSFNKKLALAAAQMAPKDLEVEVYVAELPLFSQDIENPPPKVVAEFKQKIEAADAIIFVTPEHNFTTSAVMKNAIEWGSRPMGQNSWEGKPAAIMSASAGMGGGAMAQLNLRANLVHINVFPLNNPKFMMPVASDKFDEKGNLIDDHTKEKIVELLIALRSWVKKLS